MSLALTSTVSLTGLIGNLIDVEVDISDGLPGYILLGLPDAALNESKDRVRAALVNSGEVWPNKKVTVSLSPAWLPKSGSAFDLPIALTLLMAQGLIPKDEPGTTVKFAKNNINTWNLHLSGRTSLRWTGSKCARCVASSSCSKEARFF